MKSPSFVAWGVLVAGWSVAGIVQALFRTALAPSRGDAVLDIARYDLPLAWTWAALTPIVGWAARRIGRRAPSPLATVAAHVPVLLAAAVLHAIVRRALIVAAGGSLVVPLHLTVLYYADLTVLSYLAAIWAARAMHAQPLLARRERQTQTLERQLAAAQLAYLELQLRPHFLFNALGAIAELAHEAPAAATRMLHNVIALLRSAVGAEPRGLVSLREELEMLAPYLEIQRLRFEDWLVLEVDVDEAAEEARIPAFTLQPLVENAVHHGLTRRSERGRIVIRARSAEGRLRISVLDNGVGLTARPRGERVGIGLSNLRARLEAVYAGEASLELGAEAGAGAAVHLDVPLRTNSATTGWPEDGAATDPAEPGFGTSSDEATERAESPMLQWAHRHPVVGAMAAWTVVAVLRIQHSFAYLLARERFTPEAIRDAVRYDLAVAGLWLAATPLLLWCIRRVPVRRHRLAVRLAFHAAVAFALGFALTVASRQMIGEARVPLASQAFSQLYVWNVSVYAVALLFAHLRAVREWIRERAGSAERLKKELQHARLRQAMLELRPAVLVDALERVASRIAVHPREAEESLAHIGDFLRASLDLARERLVPLRAEASAVQAYAQVLAIGSEPPLRLQLSVPLRLLDRAVPNGVLRAALDAVIGESPGGGLDVYMDVVGDEGVLEIEAGARAERGPPQMLPPSGRLDEYERQGLLDVVSHDADGVRLRMCP
jgi:two-component system sensor histidine kinase AlgZ